MDTTTERTALEGKLLPELQQIAQTLGVEGTQKLRKAGLIDAIVAASTNGEGSTRNGDEAAGTAASTTSVDERPAEGREAVRDAANGDDDAPEPSAGNEREDRGGRNDRNDRGDRNDRQGYRSSPVIRRCRCDRGECPCEPASTSFLGQDIHSFRKKDEDNEKFHSPIPAEREAPNV